MVYEKLIEKIEEKRVRRGVPLKDHLSFRVGGPCEIMVFPETEEEVAYAVRCCRQEGAAYFLLGKGSNVIAPDEGYSGVVIKLGEAFCRIGVKIIETGEAQSGNGGDLSGVTGAVAAQLGEITAQSGATLSAISKKALEYGLEGFEFASGIPGSLGGAIFMNAGAYDGEIADYIKNVRVLTPEGVIEEWSPEKCAFSYRKSAFQIGGYIVLGATLLFSKGDPSEIRRKVEDFTRRRNEKQPLTYPSAGSTFKRPQGYFAGKLIQDAGLMGVSVGGAMVSQLHAGFIINYDNATARDILDLIELVKNTVYDKFGVMLEPEVRMLG